MQGNGLSGSENVDGNRQGDDVQKLTVAQVLERFETSQSGLTTAQAEACAQKYGKNLLAQEKRKSRLLAFLANFVHLMAILLWVGGGVAMFAGIPQLGISIWLVNIINGVFSFMQEKKADDASEALKNVLPSEARVLRNGEKTKILADSLTIGDIILLEEGDKISADARLIECNDLQVDQSTLTGESNPVRKAASVVLEEGLTRSEMPNLIFAGTNVSEGTAKAVVVKIGMDTEFGKIANLTQTMKPDVSPLQKELNRLTKQVTLIAAIFGILFFLASKFLVGDSLAASFIFALSMLVAFIPEGLLPTVTLSLARAVQRMSKRHALVKKLSSVETLGSTTVICTDKTGTLTQNEMTVNYMWTVGGEYEVSGTGYAPKGEFSQNGKTVKVAEHPDLYKTVLELALCNNAKVIPPDEKNPKYIVLGDPTEACLDVAAQKAGISVEQMLQEQPRLRELPFESRRKMMSVIFSLHKPINGARRVAYTKGAPKETLDKCRFASVGGSIVALTEEMRQAAMAQNDKYAKQGLRVLAAAYRPLTEDLDLPRELSGYTPELIEQDMIFTGLVAMADPPRPEVAAAVEKCHRAGIRIIMITGDYGLTAESIARRIGIVKSAHPRVLSGVELEKLSDETLKEYLKEEVIFARVAPEQKLRVVTNLQEMDEIVAVTGDGVNDSPALKKANIGVAMGITGTDVAKEAADMILTDDNFASIVSAIEEGRAVYSNIRKFLVYILNSNMAEAVPSMIYLFSRGAIPLPLTVMQILTIDLGTDMLPALGLGTEKPEEGIMDLPPRDRKKPLLTRQVILKAFFWYGLMGSGALMLGYLFVNIRNGFPGVALAPEGTQVYQLATTMALAGIIFSQAGNVYNCRTERKSVLKSGVFSNRQINIGVIFEICLIALLSYLPPLQGVFNTAPLLPSDWLFLCIFPILWLAVDEIRKYFLRKSDEKINRRKGERT